MSLPGLLLMIWILAALMMSWGWSWQRARRNASIVDVLWACGLAGSALLAGLLRPGAAAPRALVAVCGALWGLRLAWHLWRRVRGAPEDGRYLHLRSSWQQRQLRWFALFQFQALLVPLFALPFLIAAANPHTHAQWLLLAALIWCGSTLGEWLADRQLARFRADPANRGRACRSGLWRYSRHPNYFFEWLHWFSYAAIAVGAPGGAWALSGPLLMYLFLRYLSGIPFTEAQALRSRGADYRDYQRRTSMLFPWPPRP